MTIKPGSLQLEGDWNTDAAGGFDAVADRWVEAPFARGLHRSPVEIPIATRSFYGHVGDVAVGVHVNNKDHLTLDAVAVRGGRISRGIHVLGGDIDAGADVRRRRGWRR